MLGTKIFALIMLVLLVVLSLCLAFIFLLKFYDIRKGILYLVLMVSVISAVCTGGGLYVNKKFPEAVKYINRVIFCSNKMSDYVQDNPEITELEKEIYEKYGIRVYSNVDFRKEFYDSRITTINSASDDQIVAFMLELDHVLSFYSKRAFLSIPKRMFLCSGLYDGKTKCSGLHVLGSILFDVSGNPEYFCKTINHELFHALQEQMGIRRYIRFVKSTEKCSETSDYACKNNTEHLAEAWSLSLAKSLNNEHTTILKELYPVFLKSANSYEASDIKSEVKSEIVAMKLNENEQKMYMALEEMVDKNLDAIVLPFEIENINEVLRCFDSFHSGTPLSNAVMAYGVEGYQIISIDKNVMKQAQSAKKELDMLYEENIGDIYELSEEEKIEKIYCTVRSLVDNVGNIGSMSGDKVLQEFLYKAGVEAYFSVYSVLVPYEGSIYYLTSFIDMDCFQFRYSEFGLENITFA